MRFVADASIAAAWVLPDEDTALADLAFDRLGEDTAVVPNLFWHELRNVLLKAERRGRITTQHANASMTRMRRLAIRCPADSDDDHVMALARGHQLTAYDASYLALAITEECPLASLDGRLNEAARAEGVAVLA